MCMGAVGPRFSSLYAEKIQAERDRLKAENTRLHSTHDGHGAASTPRGRAASPSATAVRDRASGSTKHDPERAASHKEPLGRLTEGATTHKDRDPASEKAIAERRLRELAASGFRKRARSPERNQRARDPTPPRKERRRTSGSRSRTRSRDRQRPRFCSACSYRIICPERMHYRGHICLGHGVFRDAVQGPRFALPFALCLLDTSQVVAGHVAGISSTPETDSGTPGGAATGTVAASMASVLIKGADATVARPIRPSASLREPPHSLPSLHHGSVAKTCWHCPAQPRPRAAVP